MPSGALAGFSLGFFKQRWQRPENVCGVHKLCVHLLVCRASEWEKNPSQFCFFDDYSEAEKETGQKGTEPEAKMEY